MLTHKDKPVILAFAGLKCSNSNASDIACNRQENCSRQVFISCISGDAMFEVYSQATDERSTLFVELYACIKEA